MTADLARLTTVANDLARSFEPTVDRAQTLDLVTRAAVDAIPGVDHAGISSQRTCRGLTVLSATHPLIYETGTLENHLGEGPRLEALQTAATTSLDRLGGSERWPAYGPAAAKLGITSQLAVIVDSRRGGLATLDLTSRSEESLAAVAPLAQLFAAQIVVMLASASAVHDLDGALATRQLVGQASGIVMQRDGLDAKEAFDALVRISQSRNLKLRDVARGLVERHGSLAPAAALSSTGDGT